MASYYYSKPEPRKVWTPTPKPLNRWCIKQTLTNGELWTCNAPTVPGKNHCDKCDAKLMEMRAPKFFGGLRSNRSQAA